MRPKILFLLTLLALAGAAFAQGPTLPAASGKTVTVNGSNALIFPTAAQLRAANALQQSNAALDTIAASNTAFGLSLSNAANAAALRTLGGLGTAAVLNTGTASGNIPVLDGSGHLPSSTIPTGVGLGSVTSVAIAAPATFSISGSPVTGSGTLTLSFATQSANTFLAGPTSGSAATPTWRILDAADMPTGYPLGNTTGTLGAANGGTGTSIGAIVVPQVASVYQDWYLNVGAVVIARAYATDAVTDTFAIKGGRIGINETSPLAALHVDDITVADNSLSALLVQRSGTTLFRIANRADEVTRAFLNSKLFVGYADYSAGVDTTARLVVAAPTGTAASLQLVGGSDPSANAEGQMWNLSADNVLMSFAGGLARGDVGLVFVQTNETSFQPSGGAMSANILGLGKGTLTLPASTGFSVGRTYRLRAGGHLTVVGGDLDVSVQIGPTTVALSDTFTPGTQTTRPWELELDITIKGRGTGTGAKSSSRGWFEVSAPGDLSESPFRQSLGLNVNTLSASAPKSIQVSADLSSSNAISLDVEWSASTAGNRIWCSYATLEVLR